MNELEDRICRLEEKLAYLEEGLEPFIEWKKKLVQDAIEFGKDIEKDKAFKWSEEEMAIIPLDDKKIAIHINTMDKESFEELIGKNPRAVVDTITNIMKKGHKPE